MSLKTQEILISQIVCDSFFEKEEEKRLTSNILKEGLLSPLVVEAHPGERFILVCGYKRYASLVGLGWNKVPCIVESPTNLDDRIAKKLMRDFNVQKMKNPERVRLVHQLLKLNWSADKISQVTGISKSVIGTYEKIRDIPQETKDLIDSLGLKQEGLLSLENIRIKLSRSNYIMVLDILKSCEILRAYSVKSIEYLTKISGFNKLPPSSIRRAVKKAIQDSRFTASTAGKVVTLEQVKSDSTKESGAYAVALDYVLEQSEELSSLIIPKLVQSAPYDKRRKLISNLELALENAKVGSRR